MTDKDIKEDYKGYVDDELHWNDIKKNIVNKNKVKKLPKKINFNFDFISTDRSHNFIFGDLKSVKEFYNSELNEDKWEENIDSITLFEHYKINDKIKNYFHIIAGSLPGIHIYCSKVKEKIDFIFIPTFLFEQVGAYYDNANAFNNNNEEFIKNILNFINSNNTNWIKLGKIETKSSKLYFGQPNFADVKYDEIEHKFEFATNHKSFEIYTIITDRIKLAELYNSQYSKFNYVDLESLYSCNDHLPKDKAFHGILLLGN